MLRIGRVNRIVLTAVFAALICYSVYQLRIIEAGYRDEAIMHEILMEYKPSPIKRTAADQLIMANNDVADASAATGSGAGAVIEAINIKAEQEQEQPVFNQGIADLQIINNDAVGWITIGGTSIDYPFVRGSDNGFYLNHDISKEPASAGTVFIDYRCGADFSGFNTILYGHHMKNGSMFHDISEFGDQDFFEAYATGEIYLEDANYTFEIFAYLVVGSTDWTSFQEMGSLEIGGAGFLGYVKSQAKCWRDVPIAPDDKLVTLSTCSYEFNNARAAIVAKIIET